METADRKVASQIQFWGVVGPGIALVTLSVIILKSSPQALYLSFATILGILASWKWKVRGLILSSISVLVLYLYQFSEITPDEHLWHIGINIAIMIGFVITALAYQEVEELIADYHTEADDKKEAANVWEAEKAAITDQIKTLQKEIQAKDTQIKSFDDLVQIARKEIANRNSAHEKLLKEFLDKQHELAYSQEQYAQAQQKIAENKDLEEQLKNLKDQLQTQAATQNSVQTLEQSLANKTQEIAVLKSQIQEALEQVKNFASLRTSDIESKNDEIARLEKELAAKTELVDKQAQYQATIQEMGEHIQTLTASKTQLEDSLAKIKQELEQKESEVNEITPETSPAWLRKLEGMYKQLRQQYDEKSVILDETRKELFLAQEKLLQLQREYEEAQNESIASMDKYLLHIIQESKHTTDELQREVDSLQALISNLMKKV